MTEQPQATTPSNDPLDSAMNAEAPKGGSGVFFGQLGVDTWYAVLQKGVGKVAFDPGQHSLDRRVTAIKLSVDAWKKDGSSFVLEREMIAESREWANHVKPSLRALNTDLRGIQHKYVRVETTPILAANGEPESYVNKAGETKQRTTLRFADIYDSEQQCREAYACYYASAQDASAPATPAPEANPRERETAQAFLAPLWAASGKDLGRFETLLKSQDLVARYFTSTSPEVLAIVAAG